MKIFFLSIAASLAAFFVSIFLPPSLKPSLFLSHLVSLSPMKKKIDEDDDDDEVIGDWLELPIHLTLEIMSKLTCSFDYARFSAVCIQWRSLYLNEEECPKLPTQVPLLILPTPTPTPTPEEEEKMHKTCFVTYMLTNEKINNNNYDHHWLRQLRLSYGVHFRGSGHGWLVTVDDNNLTHLSIELLNPFFSPEPKVIPLPPLTTLTTCETTTFPLDETDWVGSNNFYYLQKAVLSADPISKPNDYMVMAIYSVNSKLALFKPEGSGVGRWYKAEWKSINYFDGGGGMFEDVIYYKDKFYAVHSHGNVVVCDVKSRTAEDVVGPPLNGIEYSKKYIVESGGDLLQVHKKVVSLILPPSPSTPPLMKVFKLSFGNNNNELHWVEVKDLCGRALFLSNDASLSISVSHFPRCKANCIYYTNSREMAVYNLENNSFEQYYPLLMATPPWPDPIWIEPVLPIWIEPVLPRRCFSMNRTEA